MSDVPDGRAKKVIKPRRPLNQRRRRDYAIADDPDRRPTDAVVWELVRARYSKPARELGDAATTAITLADLLALEVATHARLCADAGRADPEGKEQVSLHTAKAQTRKALRALVVALAPSRRALEAAPRANACPDLTIGTPEWIRAQARRELHPPDEILD